MENQKRYCENLNERCVTDNKLFWKTVKLFFSDKIMTKEKIYLTENNELTKYLNEFFSSLLQNLYITRYKIGSDPFVGNTSI